MEAGSQDKTDKPKLSPIACKELDRKREAAERPPEQHISVAITEQQQPGKLKKTPFKFFGGRRSICTLPSFFIGRSKSQGKGPSKKGVSKSKTYDSIIDVACESRKGGAESIIGDTGFPGQETDGAKVLPNSKSAHLVVDTGSKFDFSSHETLPLGSSEVFDRKINEDKALSFPRPKKGLKGLLSSIRRHKKNKNLDLEKVEPCEHTVSAVSTEQVIKTSGAVSEIPEDAIERNQVNAHATIPYTDSSNGKDDILASDAGKLSNSQVLNEMHREAAESEIGSPDVNTAGELTCTDSEHNVIADVGNTNDVDNNLPSIPSADQISLVFSDVTSLKSFDSFTGCGDIIADQDIDSIAESTSSIERSREATKRSSCLVTYQGGGEEMATPDEIEEEYLQQLWESVTETDVSYEREPLQAMNDLGEVQAVSTQHVPPGLHKDVMHSSVEGTVMVTADLTPQSDQQESVPNSDEGYYDSITPGPEDESGDGHDIKKERLPRDSYSGDALYEFYEPDDSLSPLPVGEVFFESKAPCTEIFEHYLDFRLSVDKNPSQITRQKLGVMETEEERLAEIQNQLLYWELKREPLLARLEHPTPECPKEKQNVECKRGSADAVVKQIYVDKEQVASQNSCRTVGNNGVSASDPENPNRRDFQSVHCLEKCCGENCGQKAQGKCLNQQTKNSAFYSSLDGKGLVTQGHSGLGQTDPGTYSAYRHADDHNCRKSEYADVAGNGKANNRGNGMESECERVVSFSQALVDFTSNGTLFSSLSESLGSSHSGSSFTQNLQALPAMVTFDVVDVENEGECDQQMDMNTDEIATSFETFDNSYVQKESFAECDDRVCHMGTQSSFHSCSWGVASLPRHLSLYQLSPSMPSPLSLNRRSRSLDTESLELEFTSMRLSKSRLKSCELSAKQEGKDSVGYGINSRIGAYHYSVDHPSGSLKGWGGIVSNVGAVALEKDVHRSVQSEIDTSFMSLAPKYGRQDFDWSLQDIRASNPIPLSPRQVVRPSHLPLHTNGRQHHEVSDSHRYHRESVTKKFALVLPLDERKAVDLPHGLCFSQSPEIPVKCKPGGATQRMPHCSASSAETLTHSANYAERFESSHKTTPKGRIEHGNALLGKWVNSYGECNSNSLVALSCGEEGCS
ncbi:APC membrane recruitment protein 1-like [Rhinatrema bivittatum]|uniref:APC membrane recruitment protein 1-like n=1 Tax=Rhinatrema bivittatum TaxID=194408 RepID=UPI001128CC5E|nr:APC membrane recruitment protein 1-like [Rhinatrema bivittatum]